MSSMNRKKAKLFSADKNTTINHEGAVVHSLSAIETLFSKTMGSFFGESTFYEERSAETSFEEVRRLVSELSEEDKEYALKIALLGRKSGMIQYPLAILTACFNDERYKGEKFCDLNGRSLMRYYCDNIVLRGKDIVDVMSYQFKGIGCAPTQRGRNKPLPMQLRKCMKSRLESMSDYTMSKGLCEGKEVSLADCIKMLHPNPRAHFSIGPSINFYQRVIEGEVNFANGVQSAQTTLVESGNREVSMSEYAASIRRSTMQAVLKNLVAFHKRGCFNDEECSLAIYHKLTDEVAVQKSKLLPFRFYSAYKMVKELPYCRFSTLILDAVKDALELSVCNLPKIEGKSAILIDHSGSMRQLISEKSSLTATEVASLLGALCFKCMDADVYLFATSCELMKGLSRHSSIFDLMARIEQVYVGGSTYVDVALHTIEDYSKESKVRYDNLIMLSDSDCYIKRQSGFSLRGSTTLSSSPDEVLSGLMKSHVIRRVYLNDLTGNDFSAINTDGYNKNLVTGFTEKFVDMINFYSKVSNSRGDLRDLVDAMLSKMK